MNQNKTLLSLMPLRSLLVGSTWNFVNESNGQGLHPHKTNTTTITNEGVKNWQNMIRPFGLNLTNSFVGPIDVMSNKSSVISNVVIPC
jgi:hypothetical protein